MTSSYYIEIVTNRGHAAFPTDNDSIKIFIISPGLPLLTDRSYLDKWLLYPMERERLLGLLSRRPNTIVLSGDSHFAEMQCSNTTKGPLFEVCWGLGPLLPCASLGGLSTSIYEI